MPLAADRPACAGLLMPSHLATTEFTPSHPTSTFKETQRTLLADFLSSIALQIYLGAECGAVGQMQELQGSLLLDEDDFVA